MSYLNLPNGIPDFNKAVISFWFRVPRESLEQLKIDTEAEDAKAEGNPFHTFPRLHRIMPLLTFGRLYEGYQTDTQPGPTYGYSINQWSGGDPWVMFHTEARSEGTGAVLVNKATQPINPSVIGIQYGGEKDEEEGGGSIFNFFVYLQTRDKGGTGLYKLDRFTSNNINTGFPSGAASDAVDYEDHWNYGSNACTRSAPPPGNPHTTRGTTEDATEMYMGQFGPDSFSSAFEIDVKPDTWHHALVSFDLSKKTFTHGPEGISNNNDCGADTFTHVDNAVSDPCHLWIAFDDKNYANEDRENEGLFGSNDWLSRYNTAGYFAPGGSNKSVSWGIAGVVEDYFYDAGPAGRYTFPASPLPSSNQDFGIPAGANVFDRILRVEMAEFQLFAGFTLDTSNEEKRRAFLDFERDQDGNKIEDNDGKGTLKPVPPPKTEEILERRPDVLLHQASNWKIGKNTGSTGLLRGEGDQPDQVIEDGQFVPMAKIEQYKPDPTVKET